MPTQKHNTQNIYYVSRKGLRELRQKLHNYKREHAILRRKIVEAGSISDDDEYDVINDRLNLDFLTEEIERLQTILANCKVIRNNLFDGTVRVGAKVDLMSGGQPMSCVIVSSLEADPIEGKISDRSPLGSALLGKMIGALIKVPGPRRSFLYRIVNISYGL